MAEPKSSYLAAARCEICVATNAQSVNVLLHGNSKRAFYRAFTAGLIDDHLQPETAHRGLGLLDVILREARIIWIHKQSNSGGVWKKLMQQLQPLGGKLGSDKSDTRHRSSRTIEAGYEPWPSVDSLMYDVLSVRAGVGHRLYGSVRLRYGFGLEPLPFDRSVQLVSVGAGIGFDAGPVIIDFGALFARGVLSPSSFSTPLSPSDLRVYQTGGVLAVTISREF